MSHPEKSRIPLNFVYNVAGVLLPLALTIFTTPVYLRHIGQARFGVLALIWITVGYFGLLDLGLSRASTNRLSRAADTTEGAAILWAGIWTSFGLGCLGALMLFGGMNTFGHRFFGENAELEREVYSSLPWICLLIPLATTGGVLTGALEARHKFLEVNAINIVGAALFSLLPLFAALIFRPSLEFVIPAAALSRFITVGWIGLRAARAWEVRKVSGPTGHQVRDLLAYGGWAAISSFVGTIMNSVDQLAIGAVLGAAAVAHYVVPYNVVMRLGVIPSALLRAMFPKLSQVDAESARELEYAALGTLCVTMSVLCVGLILTARPLLHLWLGAQLAPVSVPVAIVLTVGVWFNAMANVPYWALQAQGRPEVPAKFHLLEIVPYMVLLFFALDRFGLIGVAVAWTARMAADAGLLFAGSRYSRRALKPLAGGTTFVIVLGAAALLVESTIVLLGILVITLPIMFLWGHWTEPGFLPRLNDLIRRFRMRVVAAR